MVLSGETICSPWYDPGPHIESDEAGYGEITSSDYDASYDTVQDFQDVVSGQMNEAVAKGRLTSTVKCFWLSSEFKSNE